MKFTVNYKNLKGFKEIFINSEKINLSLCPQPPPPLFLLELSIEKTLAYIKMIYIHVISLEEEITDIKKWHHKDISLHF